jgi:hypothetical protein
MLLIGRYEAPFETSRKPILSIGLASVDPPREWLAEVSAVTLSARANRQHSAFR